MNLKGMAAAVVAVALWTGDGLGPSGQVRAASPWGADYFPNVVLTTQDGRKVRLWDDLLKDKKVAINLVYTSCKDTCPLETAKLAQVQQLMGEHMGKDLHFYSIAIDPWDTPKELKAFAGKFGVGPGWLFLSGKDEDIRLVTRKLGLSRASDGDSKDGHSASLMVGNVAAGQWMRNSSMDNPVFLATTIKNFMGWREPMPVVQGYEQARPVMTPKGELMFQSKCAACHSIGAGDRIGPDLAGVTTRRSAAWLSRYLMEPDVVLAEGDPTAVQLDRKYKVRMPNLDLGSTEAAAVIGYIEQRGAAGRDVRALLPVPSGHPH
jgi:protein SCO1